MDDVDPEFVHQPADARKRRDVEPSLTRGNAERLKSPADQLRRELPLAHHGHARGESSPI